MAQPITPGPAIPGASQVSAQQTAAYYSGVCVCVCEWERESNEEKLPTIFNQTKAERFIPSTDVFGLFWCWRADLMWTSRMYVLTDEPQQFTTTPTLPIPSTFNQL